MAKVSYRILQVADVIQRELATILQREMVDPSFGMITILVVRLSRDLSSAKVFVTFLNQTEEIKVLVKKLNEKAQYFRSLLAKRVTLRSIPQLRFMHDQTLDYGNRLTDLIGRL